MVWSGEQCSGPKLNATVPDQVRFHDDQSTYTGVYARGGEYKPTLLYQSHWGTHLGRLLRNRTFCPGPTNIDNAITLSNLADRSDADVRGVKGGVSSSVREVSHEDDYESDAVVWVVFPCDTNGTYRIALLTCYAILE